MKCKKSIKLYLKYLFQIGFFILISNCSNRKISDRNLINIKDVTIISVNDSLPSNAKFIGNLKTGYFHQYKSYDSLIIKAKKQAAEMGGNVVQITSNSPYQINFEKKDINFNKIKAKVFYTKSNVERNKKKKIEISENESILNFYMLNQGPFVKKDIYLNDSIIIKKFGSNSKSQYRIKKAGNYTIKFGKKGIPLKLEIKDNQTYFLKCYVQIGLLWNKSIIKEYKDSTEFETYQ